ncbi:MAG: MarR family transcriptional regulator [Pseudomonadota bacterium]
MGSDLEQLLHHCLYFTANALARQASRMAEEEFRYTGLSPSHAFLLMLVNERPGITPMELSRALRLAPSTVTRFVDSLSLKNGLVDRRAAGKATRIYPTDKGRDLGEQLASCWRRFYDRYSKLLGEEEGRDLTAAIDRASEKLKG